MNNRNITGRDSYIIAQALAYASEWLRTLDKLNDEPSNRHDMDVFLAEFAPTLQHSLRSSARNKLRNRIADPDVDWIAIQLADIEETNAYLAEEAAEWADDDLKDVSDSEQDCRVMAAAIPAGTI